jgi:PAS domain S-box-containing protein
MRPLSLNVQPWVPTGLFHAFVAAAQDGLIITTASGEILYSSPALARLLARDAAHLLGQPVLDLLHPDDVAPLAALLAGQPDRELRQDVRCVRADGTGIWCELRVIPVSPDEAPWPRYIAFVQDVTARRALQQQVLDSEARKAGIVEASQDAIIGMDDEGRVVEWNAAATRLFGYSPQQALGQPMAELIIPPGQRASHQGAVRRHHDAGLISICGRTVEVTALRRSGETFPCELLVSAIWVGARRQFTATIHDLSQRRQVVQQARVQGRQLALITAQLPSISWTTDLQLVLTSAQGALLAERGANLADHLGHTVAQVLAGSPAAERALLVHQNALQGRDGSYTLELFGRTFDIQVTAFRDVDDQITGTLALAVDVTERTRAQQHEEDRAQVLEAIACNQPLPDTLRQLTALLEHQRPQLIAQVLIRQDDRLVLGAAPSLSPQAQQFLTAGIPIGDHAGTCAQVAATQHLCVTPDIAADPCWDVYAAAALAAGLRACWSVPLRSNTGPVLGTLALYSPHPGHPDPATLALLERTASLAAIAVEQAQQLATIALNREETLRALGLVLEYRDYETKGHTDRVVQLSMALAQQLDLPLPAREALRWGAYLHDVGKIAVPDQILLKPGKPTPEEWAVIRRHPQLGYELLKQIPALPPASLAVVLHHHERWDGGGYPAGLAGEAIPLGARLFSVVDIYDALTSARPYKAAWPQDEALAEVRRLAGNALDPRMVQAFLALDLTAPGPCEGSDAEPVIPVRAT